ncbi:tRNA pseudouridine synthase C [Ferrimonas balearica DSM 9799]|uniref:tRNA pseudouridine synthase C n=1 Tax=Ferrimonas balearica (strain DSM 9799 / CCM 4581 / KCTC 23876 / PAT) TaxID=550540 RepID=E1STM0_FERBD|nr:tRNA pseudouridine(65) synthase TruC [Ferrimonas balearica]ADN75153.1 tRNA pseudouridine synthase C [Ferrimonas balearica DSM 9799]
MIEILYQDDHLVAVHKPSGLLVHRSWLDRHETQFAMQMTRDAVGCHVFPVHRLDRPTSGVLLFTKSAETARIMSEKMAAHDIDKHYLALVRGYVHEAGELDYALKVELDDIADKMADKDKAPQEAVTRYRPLAQVELPFAVGRYPTSRYSLMALEPLTGRKHQLRRHMAHLRHPIVGDTTHGDGRHNKFYRDHFGVQRLWLIAKGLGFAHPVSGEPLWIEAPLEQEWLTLFETFGWSTAQQDYLIRS